MFAEHLHYTVLYCIVTPEAQAPKRGTRRVARLQEWEAIKEDVERLYIQEDKALQETMAVVEEKFGFVSRYDFPPLLSQR